MIQTQDLINCMNILEYLQTHSPEIISRDEIASIFNIDIRTVSRYAKRLQPLGVVSRKGKKGGYSYEGKKLFNSAFDSIDDLYAINLTLNSSRVLKMFNNKKIGGIILSEDVIFHNDTIPDKALDKMIKILDAIRAKEAIRIKYIKEGKPFECTIEPLCFKNYDGFVYLFAYYRNSLRIYSVNKLEFVDYIPEQKFEKNEQDIELIKSLPNHEIYGKDPLCSFSIEASKEIYNRLKKSFKNTIKIDYTKPSQIVNIVTRSYKEVVSILLSCGIYVRFLDKNNPVYTLYKDTINLMRKTLTD